MITWVNTNIKYLTLNSGILVNYFLVPIVGKLDHEQKLANIHIDKDPIPKYLHDRMMESMFFCVEFIWLGESER